MTAVSPFLTQLDEVLIGTEVSWAKARGRNILLTGGTGFMGTWLVELFCRANQCFGLEASLVLLTRDPEAFMARAPHLAKDPAVTLRQGDVLRFAAEDLAFSWVIHGATASSGPFAQADPLGHLQTIVEGTRRVLEAAVAVNAERLLYLSSGAVYGVQPPDLERIGEAFAGAPNLLDPGTLYAQGKRMAEHLCIQYSSRYGLDCILGRGFAFVGPGLPLNAHFAIGNFIRDLLLGGPVRVGGDGSPFRSYLYATDMALCCWLLLLEGKAGSAYNVGSDSAIQIGDLARLCASLAGAEVLIAAQQTPGQAPSRYVPSMDKVRHEIGFVPKVDLLEAIGRTVAWHRLQAESLPHPPLSRSPQ